MAGHDTGREWIQMYVTALAACLEIGPDQLGFKWEELQIMGDPNAGQGDCKVHTLRVCIQSYWSTLLFNDSEVQNIRTTPASILASHKAEILEALRRLIGRTTPVPEYKCPERWLADRDAFPGEPA